MSFTTNCFEISNIQGAKNPGRFFAKGHDNVIHGAKEEFFLWKTIFFKFSLLLEARGLSTRTKKDYHYHIRLFFESYPEACKSWEYLQRSIYRHLAGEIKPATFNLRRQYLLTFFKWCVEEGHLPKNPLKGIKKQCNVHRDIVIEKSRIISLLQCIDIGTFTGARDYAMIMLTMDTGIRPNELKQLLAGDILYDERAVHVRKHVAKDRKTRAMPFTEKTLQSLKAFEEKRRIVTIKPDIPFFCTIQGKGFGEFGWSSRMKKYSQKCGFNISPYDLRHYFSVLYLRNGGREEPLRRILGHEDERTLRWYMRLAFSDIQNDHLLASPVSNLLSA